MPRILAALVLLLLFAAPASARRGELAVGLGYTAGSADSTATSEDVDFVGATVFGAAGVAKHWELLYSARLMKEDGFFAFVGYEYDQISFQAAYRFRPEQLVRPRAKLGLTYTSAELTQVGGVTDDSDTSISWGGGLEIGRKYSGFIDFDRTEATLINADLDFTHITFGLVVRFRRAG